MKQIILASGSEARKKLLETIGLKFEIEKSNYEEDMNVKLPAYRLCQKLALGKAQDVAKNHKDAIVIGADSFGILDSKFIGKSYTNKEAKKNLRLISGEKHKLITGFAIVDSASNKFVADYDIAEVWIKKMTEKEINDYIKTGEPLHKAPPYTIEGIGAVFVEKITGSYSTVIGLPIHKLYGHLMEMGVNILEKPYYES